MEREQQSKAVPSLNGGTALAIDIATIVVGLVVLVVAADRLVISAVRIAKIFNISVVVIGAVIVGFGTSVPEFVISAIAASNGQTALAMSNVVASNTANVTLVLGLAAFVSILVTKQSVVRREGLLMLGSVCAFAAVMIDGAVSVNEGIGLVVGMVLAIGLLISWARRGDDNPEEDAAEADSEPNHIGREIVTGLVALAATVIAGRIMLTSVVSIGESAGLSVVFMGLITGVGTSLPELSAAFAGARRGESDLVLGNVLGSNIFNSLGVAGLAAILGPGDVSDIGPVLIGIMVLVALFAGVFAYTSQRISRWEGSTLVAAFLVYAALSL